MTLVYNSVCTRSLLEYSAGAQSFNNFPLLNSQLLSLPGPHPAKFSAGRARTGFSTWLTIAVTTTLSGQSDYGVLRALLVTARRGEAALTLLFAHSWTSKSSGFRR